MEKFFKLSTYTPFSEILKFIISVQPIAPRASSLFVQMSATYGISCESLNLKKFPDLFLKNTEVLLGIVLAKFIVKLIWNAAFIDLSSKY